MRSTIERRDRRPNGRAQPPSSPPEDSIDAGPFSGYAAILGLSLIALIALAAIHLFPYVTHNYRYPTGWDAPTAVLRARTVVDSGIQRFGAIRAGSPLLLAVLAGSSGRNLQTLVVVVPAVLMWAAALGAVALVRTVYDIRPVWLPVIAFITWAAFGENGMLNLHLDNLLNASLILPAFAAAACFVRWRRGALATGLLAAAAALAHWPFYAFAVAILLTALALFAAWAYLDGGRASLNTTLRSTVPLVGAVVGSAGVAGATFLARGQTGWLGARLVELRDQLRIRFLLSLRQVKTYYPFPTAVLGAIAIFPQPGAGKIPRRFFLSLVGGWTLVTALGGIAQLAGFPTAGARELHYFFPASILTALLVWWLARWLASSRARLGVAAGALVVVVAVGALAALAVSMRNNDRPWFIREAVKQVTAGSAYVSEVGGTEPVVYILEPKANLGRPTWLVVRATLPQVQLPRSYAYDGTVQDYLKGVPGQGDRSQPAPPPPSGGQGPNPMALLIQRYAPIGFKEVSAAEPGRVVAPGVAVALGPILHRPLPPIDPPIGDTLGWHLALSGLVISLILGLAGSGWAWALLPADRVIRVTLAPALGTAMIALAALAWAWVRLPLHGGWGAGPLLLAVGVGWCVALAVGVRTAASRT